MNRAGVLILVMLAMACSNKSDVDKLNFLKRGNMAFADGNAEEAVRYYNEALKIDSGFVDAWNNRGLAEMRQNKFDEAIFSFENAIKHKPDYAEAMLNSVKANIEVHQHYAALDGLEDLNRLWSDSSIIYFTRGLVYHDMDKNDLALESFEKAWQKDSTNFETLVNIANIKYHDKDYDKAIELLKNAIAKDADNFVAYNILAMSYVEQGELNEALSSITIAQTLNKRDPYIANNKGYILLELDSLEAAEEELIISMKIDPYNAWVYRNLGLLRFAQENYTEAVRMLDKAYGIDPTVDNLLADYFLALIKNDEIAKACKLIAEQDEGNDFADLRTKYCN